MRLYIPFRATWKEELGGKSWIIMWNMRLNERKYYNEVTIPYSAWNEPLSTLINQQDPAMRNIQGLHRLLFLCPQCFKLCVCMCIFKLFQQRIGFRIAKLCPWPFLSVLGHFWHLMLLKATLRAASLNFDWNFD